MSRVDPARPFRVAAYGVRLDRREVVAPGGDVRRLGPKAAAALGCLVEAAGAVVSKDRMIAAAWDEPYVSDEALTSVVYELRRAFDDDARASRVVETIRKAGFRLVAEVGPWGDDIDGSPAGPADPDRSGEAEEGFAGGGTAPLHAAEPLDPGRSESGPEPDSSLGAAARGPSLRGSGAEPPLRFRSVPLAALVAVLAILVGGVYLAFRPPSGGAEHEVGAALPIRSIAVLPSGVVRAPEEEALVDALTEMLTTELAQVCSADVVPGIVVRERDEPWGLESTRQELGVDAIAEGSVLRSGDRLWISVQLVDSRSGRLLWAGSWDRAGTAEEPALREVALEAAASLEAALHGP